MEGGKLVNEAKETAEAGAICGGWPVSDGSKVVGMGDLAFVGNQKSGKFDRAAVLYFLVRDGDFVFAAPVEDCSDVVGEGLRV